MVEKNCFELKWKFPVIYEKYWPLVLLLELTWAATVWERVGNSLEMQAVLNPASESPKAA